MSQEQAYQALIIDTGCANINSLKFAIERLGYVVGVSRDEAKIKQAPRVFLPGVGSAEFAMQGINELELKQLITSLTQPVLGICLGMQLLTRQSFENGVQTDCLNLIDTEVNGIDISGTNDAQSNGSGLRLPHMGWNTLINISDNPLFTGINEDDYFYFVHSYCAPVSGHTLAQCQYGQSFSASIYQNNFYGVQFHPERSGASGARLLRNFMELV
ncbi:imidazole glycerol phosphate synthase subunit HisH [Thalassotalea litorea]|uniref:imidazole glycerol phosphate synthase subunit HisH n=1 Tax=Thalassotalea litorea TaxID=2020715 RepID=UPI00373651BF